MRNLMRCVPRDLTYHVYAAAPRALRIRTRVLVGGTSSASFSTGLVAKNAPCAKAYARCAPLVYI